MQGQYSRKNTQTPDELPDYTCKLYETKVSRWIYIVCTSASPLYSGRQSKMRLASRRTVCSDACRWNTDENTVWAHNWSSTISVGRKISLWNTRQHRAKNAMDHVCLIGLRTLTKLRCLDRLWDFNAACFMIVCMCWREHVLCYCK
jgi:hypothetical protein